VKIIWLNKQVANSWQAKPQVNYQSLQEPIENSLYDIVLVCPSGWVIKHQISVELIEGFVLAIMLKRPCMPSYGLLSHDRWHRFSRSDYEFANSLPLLSHATSKQMFCYILPFQQGLSYKSIRVWLGIGSNSLTLLGWGSQCFFRLIHEFKLFHSIMLKHLELQSSNCEPPTTIISFWLWHVRFL